jgi:hypothetical protein
VERQLEYDFNEIERDMRVHKFGKSTYELNQARAIMGSVHMTIVVNDSDTGVMHDFSKSSKGRG